MYSAHSRADLGEQVVNRGRTNLVLVMPPGVVGLDVDAYDGKPGRDSLALLDGFCGGLPGTYLPDAPPDAAERNRSNTGQTHPQTR